MRRSERTGSESDQTGERRAGTGRGGRPRDESVDARVLQAAIALLAEGGLAALKADALATRAGVPKSTIYRRWSSLPDLAVDAVDAAFGDRRITPSVDPLVDLGVIVHRAHDLFTVSPLGTAVVQLAMELLGRPDAAEAYRRRVIAPLRDAAVDTIRRATVAGVWRGPDPETAVDMMIGTMLYRLVFLGRTPTLDEAYALADEVARNTVPRASAAPAGGEVSADGTVPSVPPRE